MKASAQALSMIKIFEGLRLTAYKPVPSEKSYTIGYGHYGVEAGMKITANEAEDLLLKDIKKCEKKVNKYNKQYQFSQNEYDALISFTYNIGSIDQLTRHGKRTKKQIGESISLYNKAGGKILPGLVKRRMIEELIYKSPDCAHQCCASRLVDSWYKN